MTVEAVILLPALILLSMLALQVAMYQHARDAASAAARQALDRARVVEGSSGAGEAAANRFLSQAGDGLRDPSVSVSRGAEEVTVVVTSDVLSVVPMWQPRVTVTVTAQVERVVE